jgi:putative oxidoreductase
MSIGLLILRIVVGLLFIGHGTQKLFGWFGGGGPAGTEGMVGSLGFRPSRPVAYLGGLAETIGGLLLAFGFLTPVGTVLIVAMMTSATLSVHIDKGVWNQNGGYELPLVYATAATAIAFGPGRFSIDALLDLGYDHRVVAIIAATLGIVLGVLANAMRKTEPAPTAASEPEERRRAA